MNKQNTSGGFLRDPRMRGAYKEFLAGRGRERVNPPGVDYNRSQQGANAVQGRQYHKAVRKPLVMPGGGVQNAIRNRSTEQSGTQAPAQTATAGFSLPLKRSRGPLV